MRILKVEPGQAPYEKEIPNTLESIQAEERDSLSRETKEVLNQLIQKMQETKSLDHSHLADLLLQLSDRLRFTSGKKQYGYLKAPLKSLWMRL